MSEVKRYDTIAEVRDGEPVVRLVENEDAYLVLATDHDRIVAEWKTVLETEQELHRERLAEKDAEIARLRTACLEALAVIGKGRCMVEDEEDMTQWHIAAGPVQARLERAALEAHDEVG